MNRDLWSGLFVIGAGVALAGAWAVTAARQSVADSTPYLVEATDLYGIREGSAVEMGGYPLGTVEKVDVFTQPELHFELTIAVRPDVNIPVGTKAVIASRTVAGGRTLQLVPPKGVAQHLEPGGRIVAEPETTLADLLASAEKVLDDLAAVTGELREASTSEQGREGLKSTMERLNRTLEDFDSALVATEALAVHLDASTSRMEPRLDQSAALLEQTLTSTDRASKQLDAWMAEGGDLDELVKQMDEALVAIEEASVALEGYDPEANPEMAATMAQLDAASASLERFMAAFERRPIRTLRKGVPEENTQ